MRRNLKNRVLKDDIRRGPPRLPPSLESQKQSIESIRHGGPGVQGGGENLKNRVLKDGHVDVVVVAEVLP